MSGIPQKRRHSLVLRSLLVGIGCLLVGYLLVLMYAQGEYLFALVTLVVSAQACGFTPTGAPMPGAMCIRDWPA